jgi:sugar/nucleoside kinase (ribokinase family)
MTGTHPDFIFLGGLREDYCITHDGTTINRALGGNAIYAAVGARLWGVEVGVLGRVGSNFPQEWLQSIEEAGIDIQGVKRLPVELDTRTFYAYLSPVERVDTHPALHYQRAGKAMPKALIDYESSTLGQDLRQNFSELAVRPEDIPRCYFGAVGLHLAPAHYLTHATVPYHFLEKNTDQLPALISIDPSERYMTPAFRDDLPRLLHGVDAFLPSEMEARSFLPHHKLSNIELARQFAAMGPGIVVIKLGSAGQIVFDRKRVECWSIPAYPGRVYDVTGAGDSYCGGFLVGMARTGSPVEAALYGTVSASLTIEGTGALFALGSTPGLANARLDALRSRVSKVVL